MNSPLPNIREDAVQRAAERIADTLDWLEQVTGQAVEQVEIESRAVMVRRGNTPPQRGRESAVRVRLSAFGERPAALWRAAKVAA